MRSRLLIVGIIIVGSLVSGCAFGDRQAKLGYPPIADDGAMAAQAAEAVPASRGDVYIGAFSDIRPDKTVVGHVRNGFGMKTAKVLPQREVTAWVHDALAHELSAAGYTIVEGAAAPAGTTALSGDILRAYCDVYFTYDGQVVLRIEAQKDGQALLNQSYSGSGSAGVNWAATGDSFSESLSLALRQALQQFMADLGSRQI